MSHHRRRPPAAVMIVLGVVLASGCTASSSPAPIAQPRGTGSADGSAAPAPPAAAQAPTGSAPETLACETPSQDLIDWAGVSIASHPGPIRASTLVYAASTDTGDWYVMGVDREHVYDDGTLTGDVPRYLGLTNGLAPPPEERKMIPISAGGLGKPWMVRWDYVSWTGDTLAAGERAAQLAIQCLDEQR